MSASLLRRMYRFPPMHRMYENRVQYELLSLETVADAFGDQAARGRRVAPSPSFCLSPLSGPKKGTGIRRPSLIVEAGAACRSVSSSQNRICRTERGLLLLAKGAAFPVVTISLRRLWSVRYFHVRSPVPLFLFCPWIKGKARRTPCIAVFNDVAEIAAFDVKLNAASKSATFRLWTTYVHDFSHVADMQCARTSRPTYDHVGKFRSPYEPWRWLKTWLCKAAV